MRAAAFPEGVFPRSLLVLCGLLAAVCAGAQLEAGSAGIYQGHAPASDAARRIFTLNLAADGTASLTTLYIGKNDATQHGRWTQSGSQIVLTFDPMGPNRPPGPITFHHRGHDLRPIRWDSSEWGRSGPPVLHRSRPRTISSKISSEPPPPAQGGL